jgi:hypothetical protein
VKVLTSLATCHVLYWSKNIFINNMSSHMFLT